MIPEHRFVLAEPEGGRLGPSPVAPAELAQQVSERLAEMLVRAANAATVAEATAERPEGRCCREVPRGRCFLLGRGRKAAPAAGVNLPDRSERCALEPKLVSLPPGASVRRSVGLFGPDFVTA